MYFSKGFRANVETISLLSQPHAEGDLRDFAALKKAYQSYLAFLQPGLPVGRSADVEFNADPEDLKAFARAFNEKSDLRDIQSSVLLEDRQDAPMKLAGARDAYLAISERYPELGLLFKLAFNTIFSLPSNEAGGGSAPRSPSRRFCARTPARCCCSTSGTRIWTRTIARGCRKRSTGSPSRAASSRSCTGANGPPNRADTFGGAGSSRRGFFSG